MLSAAVPDVVMDSATTTDSRSVTIQYDINNAALTAPLTFNVYRSAESMVDAGSELVGTTSVSPNVLGNPTLDVASVPATDPGHHQLTINLPDGLPPNPSHPFVVVVADPAHALTETNTANNTASFQKHVIGIVTHGGLQPHSWSNTGAPWAVKMANSLKSDGFDAVIPYNWVAASIHPGEAEKQGPKLARRILEVASQFPASDPVDLQFIGHSEGAVVNNVAIGVLRVHGTPQIGSGFIVDTMLDPHAANNSAIGGQSSSTHGVTGWLSKAAVGIFQLVSKDPVLSVPPNVGIAQVYFQHTPIKMATGSNHGVYNLWGQHVRGDAVYANLSGPGVSHAGDYRVQDWYEQNVVPLLANGPAFVNPGVLSGQVSGSVDLGASGLTHVVSTNQPIVTGTAFPGATVRVFAVSPGKGGSGFIGETTTDSNGNWSIASRPLRDGHYRLLVRGRVSATPTDPAIQITPRANLGRLVIDTSGRLLAKEQKAERTAAVTQ